MSTGGDDVNLNINLNDTDSGREETAAGVGRPIVIGREAAREIGQAISAEIRTQLPASDTEPRRDETTLEINRPVIISRDAAQDIGQAISTEIRNQPPPRGPLIGTETAREIGTAMARGIVAAVATRQLGAGTGGTLFGGLLGAAGFGNLLTAIGIGTTLRRGAARFGLGLGLRSLGLAGIGTTIGAIAPPLAAVAASAIAVIVAFRATQVAVSRSNELIENLGNNLQEFSGVLAAATAERDIALQQERLRRAQLLGPDVAAAVQAQTRQEVAQERLRTSLLSVITPAASEISETNANIRGDLTELLSRFPAQEIGELLRIGVVLAKLVTGVSAIEAILKQIADRQEDDEVEPDVELFLRRAGGVLDPPPAADPQAGMRPLRRPRQL